MTKLKKFSIIIVAILFLGISLVFLCNYYVVQFAINKVYNDIEEVPFNKVGLLLGTSKKLDDGRKNLYFYNRIDAAEHLFHAGKIRYIIISGDHGEKYYNEPQDMFNELVARGVPETAIYLDYAGFRTLDSIIRCKYIFGQTEVTIISQEFHNQRAIYIAAHNGMSAIGFNATGVDKYNGFKTNLREMFARVKLMIDLYVTNKGPKHLGDRIKID